MISGWLLLLIGVAIILHLPVFSVAKVVLAIVWTAGTWRDLGRQAQGQGRVTCLILNSEGAAYSRDRFGKIHKTHILKGSLVLRQWAWIRLGFDDGSHYVEWFSRRHYPPQTWRRLQRIWRHAF